MATFELYEDTAGEFRWRLTSGGDVVVDSGEGYGSKGGARRALERVQERAGGLRRRRPQIVYHRRH